ncbi:hypothetical protein B5180_12785, partial [Streptomyces sp. BF-3]
LAVPPGGGPEGLVALKTVRRDLEHAGDFRLRFRREAEAARAVRGPYVSALVDADPEAERPWLATQYIAGPSLEEAVGRHGPLPVPVVRDLGAAIARGLAAVHGARLVHRDLKPAADRLRDRPGVRRDGAHGDRCHGGVAGLHVARTRRRRPVGDGCVRCVLPGDGALLRRHRPRAVRGHRTRRDRAPHRPGAARPLPGAG